MNILGEVWERSSVRLSYARNTETNEIAVLDRNDYYPFGMNFVVSQKPKFAPKSGWENYKYNGKELQETGMTAMDFRHYMADIGRFTGMDRLSEILPTLTPYRFAFNNPIYFSDPTGLLEETNSIGTCPNCPKTPVFSPFINADDEYFYDKQTNKVTLVGQIEEVVITGKESSSVNYAWVYNNVSSSLWWFNSAVGTAVPRSGFLKYNEVWHQTKTRGISFSWQKKWKNPGAEYWRGQQIKPYQNARSLGSKLTKAAGVLLVADVAMSGQIKPSHLINAGMLAISGTGIGSIVAGIWFVTDMGTGAVNYLNGNGFKTLSDVIDESTGGPLIEMYDGIY